MIQTARQRFLEKVEKREDGCWLWKAATDRYGYGQFCYERRVIGAHRFAYEQFVGSISQGMQIDHLCRNRACVNPEHLEQVSLRENARRSPINRILSRKNGLLRRKDDLPIGVTRQGNRFRAYVHVDRKCLYLGAYETPSAASEVAECTRRRLVGIFFTPEVEIP